MAGVGLVHGGQRERGVVVPLELLLLLVRPPQRVHRRHVEVAGLVLVERPGRQVGRIGHDRPFEHRRVDDLQLLARRERGETLLGHEPPGALHLGPVGVLELEGLRMPRLGLGDLLLPGARRIELLGFRLQQRQGLGHLLLAQRLELRAVEVEQVLALQLVVHPALADRERAADLRVQVAVEEVLVLGEADARAAGGVLDPLLLAAGGADDR